MSTITGMSRESILALANEFMAAVRAGDPIRLENVYAKDVVIWHTFDCIEQNREKNIRTLIWMHKYVDGLSYDELRFAITDDGFVQQHVMRCNNPKFESPCMLRAWCKNGKISRIEEYLDSAHTRPLTDYVRSVRDKNKTNNQISINISNQ